MSIKIGRVPHATYAATAAAARAGALQAEHVATIAAAWQAPSGTGATFAALASGHRVPTGALLEAISEALEDLSEWEDSSAAADAEILEALGAWVALEDPCDPRDPCGDDPCEAHATAIAFQWETAATTADDLAASYLLEIAEHGAPVSSDVLEIARRTSGWLDDPEESQALSDATTYADEPAGTYTRWDGGWTLYRITGGPLEI